MTAPRTFGRRMPVTAPLPARRAGLAVPAPAVEIPVPPEPLAAALASAQLADPQLMDTQFAAAPHIDDELRAWQHQRLKTLPSRLPLRQLSLMASLCFGVASFVLPDSINQEADWFLYALTTASTITWLSTWVRRRKAAANAL